MMGTTSRAAGAVGLVTSSGCSSSIESSGEGFEGPAVDVKRMMWRLTNVDVDRARHGHMASVKNWWEN
eukprot:8359219-Pyramimonas_sp.AAC.2